MAVDLTPNTQMFEWLFGNTTIIGTHWLLPLILCIIIMAIVTVELQKWKIMLLPTLASLGAIGLTTSPVIYIIASIIYVNETFHVEVIGNVIRGIAKSTRKATTENPLIKLANERKNRSVTKKYADKIDMKLKLRNLKNKDVTGKTTSIAKNKFEKNHLNKLIQGAMYKKTANEILNRKTNLNKQTQEEISRTQQTNKQMFDEKRKENEVQFARNLHLAKLRKKSAEIMKGPKFEDITMPRKINDIEAIKTLDGLVKKGIINRLEANKGYKIWKRNNK